MKNDSKKWNWNETKALTFLICVILIMVGMLNIDSLLSAIFSNVSSSPDNIKGQSLFFENIDARIFYHLSVTLIVSGICVIGGLYYHELLKNERLKNERLRRHLLVNKI